MKEIRVKSFTAQKSYWLHFNARQMPRIIPESFPVLKLISPVIHRRPVLTKDEEINDRERERQIVSWSFECIIDRDIHEIHCICFSNNSPSRWFGIYSFNDVTKYKSAMKYTLPVMKSLNKRTEIDAKFWLKNINVIICANHVEPWDCSSTCI